MSNIVFSFLCNDPLNLGADGWFINIVQAQCNAHSSKTFRSRHWIDAALQLGFLGMTGTTLRSLEYVPAAILRHLGR
jgi:hypothetical protein